MRESIVIYSSFIKGAKALEDKERLKFYEALFDYGLKDEEVELDGITGALLEIAKPIIDANIRKYEKNKENGKYGKLGGRPKKSEILKELKNE